MHVAVLAFQCGHIIKAHGEFSGEICFLWKIGRNVKLNNWLDCVLWQQPPQTSGKRGKSAQSWAPCLSVAVGSHILHCPGQSSAFTHLVFPPWIEGTVKISILHASIHNYPCLPIQATAKKISDVFTALWQDSSPCLHITTTSQCIEWASAV